MAVSEFAKSAMKTQYVSKIPVGQSVKLKFDSMVEQHGAPDQFSNPDGSFGRWEFTAEDGSSYAHTHKSAVNALVISMNKADVKIGDWFTVTPTLEGDKKRFTVVKSDAPSEQEPF